MAEAMCILALLTGKCGFNWGTLSSAYVGRFYAHVRNVHISALNRIWTRTCGHLVMSGVATMSVNCRIVFAYQLTYIFSLVFIQMCKYVFSLWVYGTSVFARILMCVHTNMCKLKNSFMRLNYWKLNVIRSGIRKFADGDSRICQRIITKKNRYESNWSMLVMESWTTLEFKCCSNLIAELSLICLTLDWSSIWSILNT